MKNFKVFLALSALSLLGFTAVEVQAASSAERADVESTLATPMTSGCFRCDPDHHNECIDCNDVGFSPGRTACSPVSNPMLFCILLGTACTVAPCPG